MMRKGLLAVTMLCTLSLFGCKKQVPTNIVQRSLKNALRHAPLTASGMCGATVKELPNATITIVKRGAKPHVVPLDARVMAGGLSRFLEVVELVALATPHPSDSAGP